MAMNDTLAGNFVTELLAYALSNRVTFDVVKAYLKFNYLQREEEKLLVQWLFRNHDKTGRIATIGQIQQNFIKNDKVLDLLADISDVEIDDTSNGHNSIINTFQEYLRQMMFLESNDKVVDAYNRGEKEQAYNLFIKQAESLSRFTITDASCEAVFGDFDKRMTQRRSQDFSFRRKIATGIDELDYALGGDNGGPETGEYVLWLGGSGAGKSQCLIHLGITAARQGERVVHIQLEGTKEQCMNRYDAAWTGTLYSDMKIGEMTAKKLEVTRKIIKKLKKNDIYVKACEEWGGMTIADARKFCKEIEKKYGSIGVIIIDYLELLELGDGIRYSPKDERFRQQKLSKAMKALAMEFNAVVYTATQSNDVSLEERNDPEFVLSRNNLNEDKGKVRPTDLFFTLNTTLEESKKQQMRIFVDKAREHKGNNIIHICNNFSRSRFYDRQKTLSTEWNEEE